MFKELFPLFKERKELVYFDSAATTQKPEFLLESLKNNYIKYSYPASRSFYKEAEESYEILKKSREIISKTIFLNSKIENITFSSSATVSLNTIIYGIKNFIKKTDSIGVMIESHNSMIAPLLNLKEEIGFNLFFFDEENYQKLSELKNLKILFLTETTNITGKELNLEKINSFISKDIFKVIDCAQTFSIKNIDIEKFDADVIVGSSHKMYGPYGVSPIYISHRFFEIIDPLIVGGGNISDINFEKIKIKNGIEKISFGSISVPEIFSFSEVCEFLNKKIYDNVDLLNFYKNSIQKLYKFFEKKNEIKIISSENSRKIFSFYSEKISSHDLAQKLAYKNIAVRSGNLCSHLFFKEKNIPPLLRISIGCYNSNKDIDIIIKSFEEIL